MIRTVVWILPAGRDGVHWIVANNRWQSHFSEWAQSERIRNSLKIDLTNEYPMISGSLNGEFLRRFSRKLEIALVCFPITDRLFPTLTGEKWRRNELVDHVEANRFNQLFDIGVSFI